MGLSLLQTASSRDRDLGSDPLGLNPGPGQTIGSPSPRFCVKTGHTLSGLKTDPGESQAGLPVLTTGKDQQAQAGTVPAGPMPKPVPQGQA